jgi:hypothetical protein
MPEYEYMELDRVSASDLDVHGKNGWHVVAGTHKEAVYRKDYNGGNLDEGWTVLLERQLPLASPRDPFKEAANGS